MDMVHMCAALVQLVLVPGSNFPIDSHSWEWDGHETIRELSDIRALSGCL